MHICYVCFGWRSSTLLAWSSLSPGLEAVAGASKTTCIPVIAWAVEGNVQDLRVETKVLVVFYLEQS